MNVAITRAKEMLYISYAKSRMMYGRTLYGMLSCFIREELPEELTTRDIPRREPPRQSASYYGAPRGEERAYRHGQGFGELSRKPEIGNDRKRGAEKFGVEKLAIGERVSHGIFGSGTVLSARDMGGDVLYEVRFDNGQTKKLMATFAKLKRI